MRIGRALILIDGWLVDAQYVSVLIRHARRRHVRKRQFDGLAPRGRAAAVNELHGGLDGSDPSDRGDHRAVTHDAEPNDARQYRDAHLLAGDPEVERDAL